MCLHFLIFLITNIVVFAKKELNFFFIINTCYPELVLYCAVLLLGGPYLLYRIIIETYYPYFSVGLVFVVKLKFLKTSKSMNSFLNI